MFLLYHLLNIISNLSDVPTTTAPQKNINNAEPWPHNC